VTRLLVALALLLALVGCGQQRKPDLADVYADTTDVETFVSDTTDTSFYNDAP
jgi:Tfp pilus assembly protein PilP